MTRTRRAGAWRAAGAAAAALASAVALGACLFVPNLAASGYTACTEDEDCAAGRLCGEGLCAPPPWHDEEFDDRRLLTVTNNALSPLEAGTAIPVPLGGDTGLLPPEDVGVDLRFTDFDPAARAWQVMAVALDLEEDRFTAWIPLPRAVEPGRTGVLAWLEDDTGLGVPTILEDPSRTFAFYDDFSASTLNEATWRTVPPGSAPVVDGGRVRVLDNHALILLQPLVPPVRADVVVRINGNTCEDVFIGLIGDDRSLFTVPPTAGIALDASLDGNVMVAPTASSVPTPVAPVALVATRDSRYAFMVDGSQVRVTRDGVVLYETRELQPPFGSDPLYLALRVGGACSAEASAAWITPMPLPMPVVEAGPLVERQIFD